MEQSPEAKGVWDEWYYSRKPQEGILGKVIGRAEPNALRLSILYALVDGSESVRPEHLKAAFAVWDYCEESAVRLFGEQGEVAGTTPPLHDMLLRAIKIKPGQTKTELWNVVGHKVKADALADALAHLEARGLAHRRKEGRGERWFPGEASTGNAGGMVEGVEGGMFKQDKASEYIPPSTTFHLPPEESADYIPEEEDGFIRELQALTPSEPIDLTPKVYWHKDMANAY